MPAAVHIRGDYAVIPELQGRVTVLDKSGAIVAQIGDNPKKEQRANSGLKPEEWTEGITNSPPTVVRLIRTATSSSPSRPPSGACTSSRS